MIINIHFVPSWHTNTTIEPSPFRGPEHRYNKKNRKSIGWTTEISGMGLKLTVVIFFLKFESARGTFYTRDKNSLTQKRKFMIYEKYYNGFFSCSIVVEAENAA